MEKPELTLQEISEKFGFGAKDQYNLLNPHLVITEPVIEIDAIAYDKRYPATIEICGDLDYTLESLQSLLKYVSLKFIKNGGLIGCDSEIITSPHGRQLLKVYEVYVTDKMEPKVQSAWELLHEKIFSVYHGDGTGVEPMILKSL